MNDAAHTRGAIEIVDRVEARLPALVDRVLAQMTTEIPLYAAGAAGDREALRERLATNLAAAVAALRTRRHDPSMARATGRLRAQQKAALADVLSAYRVAFAELWDALVRAARRHPEVPADALVELSSAIFWLHNMESEAVVHAFRDETDQLLLARERERGVLVDMLVSEDLSAGHLLEVARSLRLPLEGSFLVVAFASTLGRDPMPQLGAALRAVAIESVWRLRPDMGVGVLSLATPAHEETALASLRSHASAPVGVSPIFHRLALAARNLTLAQFAVARADDRMQVRQFQDDPLSLLAAAAPETAMEVARSVLRRVLDLRADRRDLLLDTLSAWVDAGGSSDAAAAALFCHPNTVRKRLKSIEALTERDLAHPADVAALITAANAWAELAPTA